MFFWNSLAFSMIQRMLAIWSVVPLPFLNPAWFMYCSCTVHVLLKPGLENFEHYFASVWNEWNCVVVWGWEWKLFQSCGPCWVFQICWHIECSTFTASSLRIWSSSAGIPSPPLALFVVVLPQAHLTSHSRMSGSRWVILPSWLSEILLILCLLFSHSASLGFGHKYWLRYFHLNQFQIRTY